MFLRGYFELLREIIPQLLCTIFGTINTLSNGMIKQSGWSAPLILGKDGLIAMTEKDALWSELLYIVLSSIGLQIIIWFGDKIGRKRFVLAASAISLIDWALIGTTDQVEYIHAARSFIRATTDVALVCSPMYVSEIANSKIRGSLVGAISTMDLSGIVLVYNLSPLMSVSSLAIVGGSILTIQLIVLFLLPESPYLYIYNGNEEAARKSLQTLRGTDNIETEINAIEAAIERQKTEKGGLKDLFILNSNRRSIILLIIVYAAQQLMGYTPILMYFHSILKAADGDVTEIEENSAFILFLELSLFASLVSLFFVDIFGRKFLLRISILFSGTCCVLMGIFLHVKYLAVSFSDSWISTTLMIYAVAYHLGIGTVPIILTAELFPVKVKVLGMIIANGFNVLFVSVSIYVYQYLTANFGLHYSFYLFAFTSFITFLFISYIPETRGKSLEEIQLRLKR